MILEIDLLTSQDFDIDAGGSAVAKVAAKGALDGAFVMLVKAGTIYGPNVDIATLVAAVCTYAGYADGLVTFSPATITDDGKIEYQGTVPEFRPTGSTTTDSVGTVALVSAMKDKVYGVASIPGVGLPMASALDNLIVNLGVRFSGGSKARVIT